MNQKRPTSRRHLGRLLWASVLLAGALLAAVLCLLSSPSAAGHAPTAFRPIPPDAWVRLSPPKATPSASIAPTVAPTPTPRPRPTATLPPRTSHLLIGLATWYCLPGVSACMAIHPTGGMYAAAGPALRAALGSHWRGRVVTVCGSRCVRVTLADWCACGGGHTIDLYSDAFRQIAPLSSGVVGVVIRW
jgi:hypothetical protein